MRAGIFVVPTLTITESFMDMGGGAELAADPRVTPFLTPAQGGGLRSGFGGSPSPDAMRRVLDRIGALHAAGVPLLAGSDAPNPGTAHGASVHRELELLVRAGLSPVEALLAATAAPADAFGLDDRGRIAPGRKADLVLVRGALVISGEIAAGFPAPWAGVMIGLAPGMMQPVDASDITALVFDARGEGAAYRVLAFAESLGPAPATIEFSAGAGWRRVVVPLGGIDGLDPTGAMGFLIGGPGDLGPFRLEIDNVELR